MRFFNAILALPFIAAVVGSPVPTADKRALASSSSNPLDLVSILGDLKTKIQPTLTLLEYGGGLVPASTAEDHVAHLKDSFSEFKGLIDGLSPDQVTGNPKDIADEWNTMVKNMESAFTNKSADLNNVPGFGSIVRALEAEIGGVIIALRNQVPALGDSLAGLPNLLGGTVGGILDNLLGGGLSKLGQ